MTDESERRVSERWRVLKAGIIAYNDRHSTIPCTVRDVSPTGARLMVENALSVPDTFELILDLDGIEVRCEVVGRRGGEVRIRFLEAPRAVEPKRIQVLNANVPAKPPSLRRKPRI